MKKYVIVLLILIFSIFIGTNNVFAVDVIAQFEGGGYNTGITWKEYGNDAGDTGPYIDHQKVVVLNGQKFPAYCLDPGLKLNSGTKYSCTPTSDPGLIYLVNQGTGGNYTEVQLAIRFYAAMKGYGSGRLAEMKAAVARFFQIKKGMAGILTAACHEAYETDAEAGNRYSCSVNEYDYLSGNNGLVDQGYQLAVSAWGAGKGASTASGGLTFTKTAASTKTQITYNVTSLQEIKKVKFVCEGCTIVGADDNFSGRSGTLVVTPPADCESFRIKAYFVPSGIHICSNSDTSLAINYQYLVANFDASEYATDGEIDTSGEPSDIHEDRGIDCDPECCTEVDIKPNYIVGEINNCCLDSTHSWAKEYDLNQLTCYSDEFLVNHYWKMCNSETYLDQKMNGDLNEYCDVYCTERVTVDIPGAITATSGRYFDLTTTGQGTKSPYIEGFKRCRTLIHFKKWQDDYRKQVEEQVKQYNEYQRNRLYELIYEDALNKTRDCSLTITVDCVGTKDGPTSGYADSAGIYPCTAEVDLTGETETKEFGPTAYTEYQFTNPAHNHKYWHYVKLDERGFKADADGYYKYYKILKDNKEQANHRDISLWETIPTIDAANQFAASKEKTVSAGAGDCAVSASVSCTITYSDTCGYNSESPHREYQENVEAAHASYQSAANAAKAAYNAAAQNAKTLEEKIDKCDEYFTKYEGTDAETNFPFKASFFGFEYTQIYLTDFGDLKKDVSIVPFDSAPGCQISGPLFSYGDEDMLVDPQYSTKYVDGDHKTQAEDFRVANLEWQEFETGFEQYRDEEYEADQKFVQDAKYQAVCSWDEPENTKYTLVQKGNVLENDFNVTKNDRQYQVHLATLEGEYDTRWLLSGLGTNSKFDAYFAENGAVCSGRQSATTDGLFHCVLKVDYEIISTGKCNGERSTTETDECEIFHGTESVLNFKIVDPAQVFTCNSFDECGYGYNWFVTDDSRTLNDIRRKGRDGSTYSPANLSYQATFTTNDMKHVKNYNEYRENNNYGGYSDFSLNCECPDQTEECNEVAGTQTCKRSESCKKCRSIFLNDLYNGIVSYGGGSHSVTGAKGSIESVRNNGHVHWAG